jgi:hypothetical protein
MPQQPDRIPLHNMKTMAAKLGCNEKRFRAFFRENEEYIGPSIGRAFTPRQSQIIESLWKRSRYRWMPTRKRKKASEEDF